jgi:hypothetical protein
VVAASGIPSARKKLTRARTHLGTLRRAVRSFQQRSSYEFAVGSPGNVRWQPDIPVMVTVTQAPPIPDTWALITGDILTNARAALDHAVFPHIRARKPNLDRKLIQYPIEDRKDQWENKNRWFTKSVLNVVGESQPYRSADPTGHPLRLLRELVNMDKHRDLIIAEYAMAAFVVAPHDLYEVVSTTVHKGIAMKPGAVVAEAQLRLVRNVQGEQLMQMASEVEYGAYIEIPARADPMSLISAMDQIVRPIGKLLDELEKAGC